MSIIVSDINEWFNRSGVKLEDQFRFHLEEIREMFDAIGDEDSGNVVRDLESTYKAFPLLLSNKSMRVALLDALADQIVTSIGLMNKMGVNPADVLNEVSKSNWSKYDDEGNPIRNADGKVVKGPNYRKADFEQFIKE